jgi:hypothetical protein
VTVRRVARALAGSFALGDAGIQFTQVPMQVLLE